LPNISDIAFIEKLFVAYYPSLCSFAKHYLGDLQAAEDIVQEMFAALLNNPRKLREKESASAYLYSSVKNKCLNQIKHQHVTERFKQSEIKDKEETSFYSDHIIEEETHRRIYQAIDTLPVRCREVISLGLKGLKNNEIAEVLEISVNTVKTQKKIAYEQLRFHLKDIFILSPFLIHQLFH
jgi:RNA polymerase sigma-70 factor (ECF subfamily)